MISSARTALDDLPGVHHEQLVGDVARRGDVVGDVEQRELEATAQVVKQGEHLESDGDVQHRDRLVGEEHAGAGGESAGERDPLPLAARELVGVLLEELPGGRETHLSHQGVDLFLNVAVRFVPMQHHGALEVVMNRMSRVQRSERVLEDELDLALVSSEGAPVETSTGSPSRRIEPEVGCSCPARSLATVVLPDPLSPTKAMTRLDRD